MSRSGSIDQDQERRWIAGLRAGRVELFRELFDAYGPRLCHFACVWVSRDVAEDIVQDVLFDLWQRRHEISLRGESLAAYLFAAVRYRVSHILRHDSVVVRTEDAGLSEPPGMGGGAPSPDAQLLADDLYVSVEAAIAELSDLQRAVLMLRWTQELTFAQIGESLSISENAAKLHLSRARQRLAPLLRWLITESESG